MGTGAQGGLSGQSRTVPPRRSLGATREDNYPEEQEVLPRENSHHVIGGAGGQVHPQDTWGTALILGGPGGRGCGRSAGHAYRQQSPFTAPTG